MTDKHPRPGSRGYPVTVSHVLKIEIVDDSTITVARIYNAEENGQAVAAGVAKRHRNDKRNTDLGRSLALARAYRNLAAQYDLVAERLAASAQSNPDEDRAMRNARKLSRAASKARKDERRKGAREAYAAKSSGWAQRVFDGRDGVA